ESRHAGEVLEQDAAGGKRDLLGWKGRRVPVRQRLDVGGADAEAVLGAEQVFQQDLERVRQASGLGELLLDGIETIDGVAAITDNESGLAAERVVHRRVLQGRKKEVQESLLSVLSDAGPSS